MELEHFHETITTQLNANFEDDLEFLENKTGPANKIKEKWEKTTHYRMSILHKDKISTDLYLNQYPYLKSRDGFELVNCFFKTYSM